MKIATIGLGKLGYPMCEFLSSSGCSVKVYDNNPKYVNDLKSGKIKFHESGLGKYISNGNNVIFCNTIAEAISETNICFITVPTPSKKNGDFSNDYILDVLNEICLAIKEIKNKKPLIININSTVSPGTFDSVLIPFMTKKGLKLNEDFCFVYNPYFVALGNVINNLERPDMVLVGTSSIYASKTINRFYNGIYNSPNIKMMSLQEAEIVKLALNSYLTLKISYSNNLLGSIKKIKNIDPVRIFDAIGSDERIGKHFLMPGGPFAGPCLPRDTYALKNFYENINHPTYLVDTINKINEDALNSLFRDFKKMNSKYGIKKIGFFGLGYRPNTSNIDDSFALKLYDLCKSEGFEVRYLDHYLEDNIRPNQVFDEESLVEFADVVFLSYIDFKNKNLLKSDLYKNTIIWDIWYQFREQKSSKIINNINQLNNINLTNDNKNFNRLKLVK